MEGSFQGRIETEVQIPSHLILVTVKRSHIGRHGGSVNGRIPTAQVVDMSQSGP